MGLRPRRVPKLTTSRIDGSSRADVCFTVVLNRSPQYARLK
jgi:hypothetical protein